ncbi:hypothetical protein [Zeimonas arvi]|uniref:Uncharacterized protein n=1 Tax=Zeimonas arvi TaxID=2498847 RepID=A0A5C8NMV0_9BURK|nr:hypothetical protein [Zeimonas arvi]TXL62466.1 hypothetical protein FHP08_18050 [Zeimonas arvi]
MNFIQIYGKEIFALLVPVVGWLLGTYFRTRARLEVAQPHRFTFNVQQPLVDQDGNVVKPTQVVDTKSMLIRNAGRDTATRVELVFNWKPMCINIWPARHAVEHIEPDNRYVLVFESLAPGEFLGCEILAVNQNLPDLITVRSDQCVAKTIEMYPQPILSTFTRRMSVAFFTIGLATSVYLATVLIQFLVLGTPVVLPELPEIR